MPAQERHNDHTRRNHNAHRIVPLRHLPVIAFLLVVCAVACLSGTTIRGGCQIPRYASVALGLLPSPAFDSLKASLVSSTGMTYKEAIGWRGTLPSEGEARILAIRVSFPGLPDEERFQAGDDASALQAIIGRHTDGTISERNVSGFPYESLYSYYLRSSYGRLRISGEAYDYEARHPREHYAGDLTMLFAEALGYLDEEIDYGDFDGDGDGTIDCVSIRFEGGYDRFKSSWWSQVIQPGHIGDETDKITSEVPADISFDGRRLGSLMMLHHPSDDPLAYTTFIHECGHVLGVPDYYSDLSSAGETVPEEFVPGGIGTYDMMNNNQGDHNAFSKWMVGWLDDDNVIRVTCDENGNAVATLGGKTLPTDDRGRVNLDVSPISDTDCDEPIKAVAIYPRGNDGRMGPLSDFYLLQYDSFVGNQSLYWGGVSERRELTGGFRMFRVQASPTMSWDGLEHSNREGSRHDQLIEIVDPDDADGEAWHVSHPSLNIVPTSEILIDDWGVQPLHRDWHYGCSLHAGDKVTPDTEPSTNFFEDGSLGRTGIALKVMRSEDDGGTVRICYVD